MKKKQANSFSPSKVEGFKPSKAKPAKPLSAFAKRVYAVVARIPKSKVMTYKEVAIKAGKPQAARAVGILMSKNYDPKVPCHRVVRSDGRIGNYNRGGPPRKLELLWEEGFRP